MTKDLDDRIADLEAKRRENSLATARDAERVVEELNGAVCKASLSVGGLNARTDLIDERASALERRIRQLWVAQKNKKTLKSIRKREKALAKVVKPSQKSVKPTNEKAGSQ